MKNFLIFSSLISLLATALYPTSIMTKSFHGENRACILPTAPTTETDNPPKIFQIGFNKCGTTSLHVFFQKNNIPSIHWHDGRLAKTMYDNYKHGQKLLSKEYSKYTAFFDMENCLEGIYIAQLLFKKLDKEYPGAKFILNTRNKEKWIKSRLQHNLPFCNKPTKYITVCALLNNVSENEMVSKWRHEWDEHHAAVKKYFKYRPQDLLIFDIESDPPTKICEFFKDYYKLNPVHYEKLNVTKIASAHKPEVRAP
jgi:hypothetical protein